MPTYLRLVKLTEHGARNAERLGEFMADARKILEKVGGKVVQAWATLGRYDFVAVWEAPDDKTAMVASGMIGTRGFVTAETLPAISSQELVEGLSP